MTKHYPLGCAGSSRSVNDRCRIFITDPVRDWFYLCDPFWRTLCNHFLPVTGIDDMFKGEDLLYRRDAIFNAHHFVKSILIIYENDLYLGIVQNKFELVYINSRINRGQQGADLLHGQVKEYPFGTVLAENGYLITSLHRHIIWTDAH